MPIVLIVDDDPDLREALEEATLALGFSARLAATGAAALAILDEGPVDAVLLDLRMPGIDGIETLRRIRLRPQPPQVTVLTAHATAENTIEAMRLGAFDHMTKPISKADLKRVLTGMAAAGPTTKAGEEKAGVNEIVGASEPIRSLQKAIGRIADSEATVLVTGETGTGKELVARAVHDHGRRRGRAFVAVNCAAIPEDLIESELFGHVRGAFTGAVGERLGAFRGADGGTLFLDEIGDMDIAMQAKILRVLQERVVTPVGGKPIPVDVRVIAATHRDLAARVRDGAFRQDLFYRLHVVPLRLPALRERRSDIAALADRFLAGTGKRLSDAALARLTQHDWPGNVRELRNALQRAALMSRAETIEADDLAFLAATANPVAAAFDWPDEDLPTAIERLEIALISRALKRAGGNRAEAARRLGIHRQLLYVKLSRYRLDLSGERTTDVGEPDE